MKITAISFILICTLLWGCASTPPATENSSPPKRSKTYTTSFPNRDVSSQLKRIQNSIKRISATGIYITYFFEDRLLTKKELDTYDIEEIATRRLTSNESTAGTAVSIFANDRYIGLLTNAHVVDFPDTLISYIENEDVKPETFVKSVKIKKNQNNLIYDLPYVGSFDIVGFDIRADLALLRVSLNDFPDLDAPRLPIAIGDPADLGWGSFVYIMGYPKGYPMITRGIVSDPQRNDNDDFLTDALFNPGISGGLIIASRDSFRSFEWIGMTNTASADIEKRLVPDPAKASSYQTFDPYLDSPYVEIKTQLSYGITQSIPMKKIISFLKEHQRELRRMGFRLNRFELP